MMYTLSSNKINQNAPELSHGEKLEQIRSGRTLKRTKSGLQKKSVVVHGNDGSKIIKNQTEEKIEESGVTKKKRNYIMYESKLQTEKNTQITEIKKKKIPVRQLSKRVEQKIIVKKKRKEYLDNYQYHETKVLKDNNPKLQSVVVHKRLGDIIGGFYDEKIVEQISKYSTNTYQPKRQPTIYSTKTTVIKTPYKPLQALYKPLESPYKSIRTNTTHKRLQTPYIPYRPSFISSQASLPSYQTIQTSSISSTKPFYESTVTPYRPIHKTIRPSLKTPYHEIRPYNTEIFRNINSTRINAKTPRYNTKPLTRVNRRSNDNYNYSSQTYRVTKPNNVVTRKTDNVLNYIKSIRGKTPSTYDTKKEVKSTITSYKKREQPTPQNLYQNKYQTNDNKTTITKQFLSKSSKIFTEDEPKGRFEDDLYTTKTITTVTKISKTIEEDNGILSKGFNESEQNYVIDNGRNNQNESSKVEIKIEKKKEVYKDGEYGKGPSIRNKYKRKKH